MKQKFKKRVKEYMVCGPKLTLEVWWKESSAIFADCVDLVSHIGTIIFKGSKPGCA
jgi:hypothetical protein